MDYSRRKIFCTHSNSFFGTQYFRNTVLKSLSCSLGCRSSFRVDGDLIKTADGLNFVDVDAPASFVLESSFASSVDSVAISDGTVNSKFTASRYNPAAGCFLDELLLEIDTWFNATKVVALCSAEDPFFVSRPFHCLPVSRLPITVLTAFDQSDAPFYKVRVNGKIVFQREGPFYAPPLGTNVRVFNPLVSPQEFPEASEDSSGNTG